jgi:hypothetical protein
MSIIGPLPPTRRRASKRPGFVLRLAALLVIVLPQPQHDGFFVDHATVVRAAPVRALRKPGGKI